MLRGSITLLCCTLAFLGCGKDTGVNVELEKPAAVAMADSASVGAGGQVTLSGGKSRDAVGGTMTFHWGQSTSNPAAVSFSTNDSPGAVEVRVTLQGPGTYAFILIVENAQGLRSAPDTVMVNVRRPDLTVDLPGGARMELIWIVPGTFTMGSPDADTLAYDWEKPQHEVALVQGFYLGKYEITQWQWEVVMGSAPWRGEEDVEESTDNPAVSISWEDVQAFIHQLNQAAGDSLYRLPTEAEWEYACRAGTTTPWSSGDDEARLADCAWYYANAWDAGERYAHPVGLKQPNPWGLYDMHGNVWEWVQDWYGIYSSDRQTDRTGPKASAERILRGGDFYNRARNLRSAYRGYAAPGDRTYYVGARLVRIK